MNKVLLVIDMQEVCVGEEHAKQFKYDKSIVAKVNEVIAANENIVYVRNLMKKNFINLFASVKVFDGEKEAELAKNLLKKGSVVFSKYKGDAFSNPELVDLLKMKSVDEVEIIGVDGGGCVALTALGAIENGYKVKLNTSAIGTIFTDKRDKYYAKLKEKGAQI